MNERILSAINSLNDKVDTLDKRFDNYKEDEVRLNVASMGAKLDRYSIKDGQWMYGGYPTGEAAVGPQGPKGDKGDKGDKGEGVNFDDLTPEQIALITGADGINGKDGKDGKDGKPGKDGKDGKDGKPGKDGKDGKDGETPELEIGNIKSISTYDPAKVTLRKTDNKYLIDMDIPRGRPGSDGADGSNGNPALINGVNTLNIEAGTNISIDQQGDTLTINSTGGGGGSEEDNITITKNSQNKIQTVGIIDQNAGGAIKYWEGTQAQYDAISTKDNNTIYYITDSEDVYITNTVNDLVNYYKKTETFTKQEVNNLVGAKYTKPSGGIPATDLTTSVQTTLTKADNQVWYGTQAQYDALSQKNPDTLYCIVES